MEKKGTGAEHVSYRHNVFRNKMLGFEKILFIIMVSVNILYIIVSFADKNLPARRYNKINIRYGGPDYKLLFIQNN